MPKLNLFSTPDLTVGVLHPKNRFKTTSFRRRKKSSKMSWLLCFITVVSVGQLVTANTACSWKSYSDSNIAGGIAKPATSLDDCQSICLATTGCLSLDYDPATKGCWILYTQTGRKPATGIYHYDYVCTDPCNPNPCLNSGQCSNGLCTCSGGFTGPTCGTAPATKTDLMKNPNIFSGVKTNYQGSLADLISSQYGITWNVDLPSFTVDWPSSFSSLPIRDVKYSSSSNLAYIRLKVIDRYGNSRFSEAITSSPYRVSGFDSISKVVVYFAPIDFRKEVAVDGFDITHCTGILSILGICTTQSVFKSGGLLDLVPILTLGLISFGSNGGVRYSSLPEFPYIEADLDVLGIGPSQFYGVGFSQINNIRSAVVKVTENNFPVTTFNTNGLATDTFYFAQDTSTSKNGIWFGRGVRGDKIRVELVPSQIAEQKTQFSVTVRGLSIFLS